MTLSYKIEFEDQGQDLIHLIVDAETGVITDAGLIHRLAIGDCVVDVAQLTENRMVHFRRGDEEPTHFRYPMIRLWLGDDIMADAS